MRLSASKQYKNSLLMFSQPSLTWSKKCLSKGNRSKRKQSRNQSSVCVLMEFARQASLLAKDATADGQEITATLLLPTKLYKM